MNIMVLDVELNQPSRKVIQIGAAVFNARNAALIERLELYVNPNEPIDPFITELTGITNSDVAGGVTIYEAYNELKRFHAKHKCFRNPMVWGSGVRNDSIAIYEDYLKFGDSLGENDLDFDTENFMGFRVIDVKTIYQSQAIFENSQYAGGLKDCMKKMGLEFEGEAHRALTDAINTFRIWYHLMRIFHDGKTAQRKAGK